MSIRGLAYIPEKGLFLRRVRGATVLTRVGVRGPFVGSCLRG